MSRSGGKTPPQPSPGWGGSGGEGKTPPQPSPKGEGVGERE